MMNLNVHIILCALSAFLSGANMISAQSTDIGTKVSADSTYHDTTDALADATREMSSNRLPEIRGGKDAAAAQVNSCVNSFTDQTVSTTVSVSGCNILTVQNVTVTGSGNLSLSAPSEVVISGPFDVLSGGTLDVTGGGGPQTSDFTFSYDASGNRTSRLTGADAARKAAAVSKKSD